MKTHIRSGYDLQAPVISRYPRLLLLVILSLFFSTPVWAQEHLFETVGAPEVSRLPDFVSQAQPIRINRRALEASSMVIDIFGEQFIAERDSIERRKPGQLVWVGHIQGIELDSVIITIDGNTVSGLIQRGNRMFRLGVGNDKGPRLYEIDVEALPPDDADPLPDGGGGTTEATETPSDTGTPVEDAIVQDLFVVYNQGACDKDGGCAQLEADIVTAVADMNTAYANSDIMIRMNLVGTARTVYVPSTSLQALYDLQGTTDGYMDEIHSLRNQRGADLVSFVYDGPGCGIGFLRATASSAFSVVAVECLVGNRSMAHEIGHNQGAHHDRTTVGTTSTGDYNYGYRRCQDGSTEDLGTPYFRTILSYPCTNSPRVGRFSNPGIVYQGVPQGVDPKLDPTRGAWNSRVLNEGGITVSGFRATAATTVPAAPSMLQATTGSYDTIAVTWADNANNETAFILQSSPDSAIWSTIATLPADTKSFQHNGLLPESTHYYRVRADNSVGSSGYSNIAADTTLARPAAVEDLATSERFVAGTVSGTYVNTQVKDGVFEKITEQSSGGSKNRRTMRYTHSWDFDVLGGAGGVTFSIAAKVSGSEGANLYYSTDGGSTFRFMFLLNSTSATETKSFALPSGISGPVLIQARDSQSVQGEPQDSLFVDYMVMTSYTQ